MLAFYYWFSYPEIMLFAFVLVLVHHSLVFSPALASFLYTSPGSVPVLLSMLLLFLFACPGSLPFLLPCIFPSLQPSYSPFCLPLHSSCYTALAIFFLSCVPACLPALTVLIFSGPGSIPALLLCQYSCFPPFHSVCSAGQPSLLPSSSPKLLPPPPLHNTKVHCTPALPGCRVH